LLDFSGDLLRVNTVAPARELSDTEAAMVVRDGYDNIADRYASYTAAAPDHPRHAWLHRLLTRMAAGSRVLELGCGSGVPTAADVVGAGHSLVGVDISAGQLDLARHAVPSATFIHADFADITFDAGTFDAVIALFSMTHVPRHRYPALFGGIREWIAPDGWFLASLGTSDSSGWLEDDFLGFGGTSWTNSFDPSMTEALLREAGLSPDVIELVEHEEAWGQERWLYVLARPA
jgi:cyclopropane fatty-acyl-phospholipid synthase-like methyltransferase